MTKTKSVNASQDVVSSLDLKEITLFESTAIRYDDVEWSGSMSVDATIENENGRLVGRRLESRSICSLSIKNDDGNDVALFISHYRPVFELKPNLEALDSDFNEGTPMGDLLNQSVLHEAYPYHRHLLSDMMSRMGLPIFLLPLMGVKAPSPAKSATE